ncbi:MAG: fibronectin type III domain-containing protein [Clostridia bacterium]|nr:fibronectin type III domain-containing protein [Clostridia bacterium]
MKKVISFILAMIMIIGGFSILSTVSFAKEVKAEKISYVCTKERTFLTDSMDPEEETTYTYDSNGNLTKKREFDEIGINTITYSYDSKGNVIRRRCNDNIDTTYTYDSNGNLIEEFEKNGDGWDYYDDDCVTRTNTYTYDGKSNLTKAVVKYSDGYTYTTTYTYNSKGNLTKKVTKYSNGHTSTTTYTYDSKGNLMKKVVKDSDGDTTTYTYGDDWTTQTATCTYDSKGNLIKKAIKDFNGNTTTYIYDSKGNLTKKVEEDSDGRTYTTTYTYDSNGNLIKKSISSDSYANPTTTTYEYAKAVKTVYETEDYRFVYNGTAKYTGKAICPVVAVFENESSAGNIVCKGPHYKVTYKNNTKIGTAYMTLTFNDGMQVTLPFRIKGRVTGLKATPATTSIKLNWTKYTGAKYYKVEQSTDGKTWKKLGTVSTNTYTVKSLKAGKKYQYRVTALDSSKKAYSYVSYVLKTGTKTAAPTVTLKSAKSKTVTASWAKVTGAAKYAVYKSTDGKTYKKVATTTGRTYTLSKLTGGKKVYVKVKAINAYGAYSAYSTAKKITVKK